MDMKMVVGLMILPILVAGCTTFAKEQNKVFENNTVIGGVLPTTLPEPASSDDWNAQIQELDKLAKEVSLIETYEENEWDCSQYSQEFVKEAVKKGYTCRWVSGIGWNWGCHAWSQCDLHGRIITIDPTQSRTIIHTENLGDVTAYTEAKGVIENSEPLTYVVLCAENWNSTNIKQCDSVTVCNMVLRQKYLNNSMGDANG